MSTAVFLLISENSPNKKGQKEKKVMTDEVVAFFYSGAFKNIVISNILILMRKALLLLFTLLLVVSCSNNKNEEKANINIAVSQEPVTLDVMTNSSLMGRIVASGNIYEKLLVLDGEGNIREELCESYSLSNDNKRLTFVLRDGVLFHDGTVLTAEDAVASMNRYLKLYSVASSIVSGAEFKVIDEKTIEITSASSLLFLPLLIASSPMEAVIMPERVINDDGSVSEYIGTGPYYLERWVPGEKIVLEKFNSYSEYGEYSSGRWGKKSALNDGLTYWFVPDAVIRTLGLESGEYDFINDVMSTDFERLEKNENIVLLDGDESGSIALVYNKKEGVMADGDVRKAVSLALDSSLLMAACYGKSGYTLSSSYMESFQKDWLENEENPYSSYEPESARSLIDGKGKIKVRVLTSSLSNLDKIATVVKENLENIGIECEIITLDWASFVERRKDSSFWDIYISAFTTVPLPQMKSYFQPSFPGWMDEESPSYDVLKKMGEAATIEEAVAIWCEGQSVLFDYNPIYIAGHYSTVYAHTSSLKNVTVQNGFFFWHSSKDE